VKNILTFVIPVRHQDTAKDWQRLKRQLGETVASIACQDREGWKAIVVANYGADLPDLPKGFEVKRVDFPPNPKPSPETATKEEIHDVTRIDKGYRVLAGMLHAGEMGHVMVVDNDDFVSRRLTSFVAASPKANGWYLRDGYVWGEGGRTLFLFTDFSRLCGTSHIVRADLYELPGSFESADENYVRYMLGSHAFLHDHLDKTGNPLAVLPFAGAVYRTNHGESLSGSGSTLRRYFFRRKMLTSPTMFYDRVRRLHLKTSGIEREFMGVATSRPLA
jgi:hypothetical protein